MGTWPIEPASACSCVQSDAGEKIERSEAAFIGRIVSRVEPFRGDIWSSADLVTYTFEVESVAKGDLTEFLDVLSPIGGATCGFGDVARVGSRMAITTWTDEEGNYQSGSCSVMVPSEMISVSVMRDPAPGHISVVPSPVPSDDGEALDDSASVGAVPESEPKPIDPTVVPSTDGEQSAESPSWHPLAIIGLILIVLTIGGYGVLARRQRSPNI
jgi:hypothetical protein